MNVVVIGDVQEPSDMFEIAAVLVVLEARISHLSSSLSRASPLIELSIPHLVIKASLFSHNSYSILLQV